MNQGSDLTQENRKRTGPRRKDHSAGGIAYRFTAEDECEIALIATQRGTRWQLPKGTCEDGETLEETAVREVEEETGLLTTTEGLLKTIIYTYYDTYRKEEPVLVNKRVDLYLLRVIGGELSDASHEVDSVAWFTPQQALSVLAFDAEKEVVQIAIARLANLNGGKQ